MAKTAAKLPPTNTYGKRRGMTKREYAAHAGVTYTTVCRWLTAGVISAMKDGGINPTTADIERANNLQRKPKGQPAGRPAAGKIPATNGTEPNETGELYDYYKARAEKEHWAAKKVELDYAKAAGEVIERRIVEEEVFPMVRSTRDRVLGTVDYLAKQVARLSDERACRDVIERKLRQALETLSDELELTGSDAG